jgi:hypothetical protein
VLVIDIGGADVKLYTNGHRGEREFDSGPKLTPRKMVSKVQKLVPDWDYDVISIGCFSEPPGGRSMEFRRCRPRRWKRPQIKEAAAKEPRGRQLKRFLGGLRLWQNNRTSRVMGRLKSSKDERRKRKTGAV